MRYAIKLGKLMRGQKGQATISAAMILMLIGGILIPPCLGFAVASLKASQSGEQVLKGRYAADSGVEDAVWRISDGNLSMPVYSYSLVEEVNDRDVDVTIQDKGGGFYKIISTATSDTGGNATVECYVLNIAGFNLFDNAITSNGTIDIKGNVNGSVVAADCGDDPNCNETQINWPSEEQLSAYYWDDVKDLEPPFPYNHPMDIAGTNTTIEALYRDGPWTIYNIGNSATLTLNGTVYVTGDLKIGTEKQDFTLNLNNQTIYCESTTEKWAIEVGGKCTIIGSGCIIAVGGIYFAPKGDVGSEGDFVFIMSVEDWVWLQPVGNFYGAVAGNTNVNLWPNTNLTWTASGGRGNFPTEGEGVMKVYSYTIK